MGRHLFCYLHPERFVDFQNAFGQRMQPPLFTIIIPAFNAASKLAVTLESVFTQHGATYEVIVMDGASTDSTVELLKDYGARVIWRSEPDAGVYDAMNKAIPIAKGQMLYFLGAGDTLRPNALAEVAKHLPEPASSTPTFLYANAHDPLNRRYFTGQFSCWRICRVNVCHQAVFYDKRIFGLVGLYDLKYKVVADWVLNIKIFGFEGIRKIYVPDLVVADFEGGGMSDQSPDEAFANDRLSLIRAHSGAGPYTVNKLISMIPAQWKDTRYRGWRKLTGRHGGDQ